MADASGLSVRSDTVCVFLVAPAGFLRAREDEALALLSPRERERHDRFRVAAAREEFLSGRALLRTALSRARGDVAPEDWRFRENAYGRPAIDWTSSGGEPSALFFNLSHTRGLAALALHPDERIGIDVEAIARRRPDRDVARRFFTGEEADWIAKGAEDDARTERFFALWTLKEAYIKARGMGLALPLDGFRFDCEASPPTIAFNEKIEDDPARWRLSRMGAGETHRLALACPAGVSAIRLFDVDAFGGEPAERRAIEAPALP